MNKIVFYHANCADGFGAAFAAWLKLGDEATYVPVRYGQVNTVADMNSLLAQNGIPEPDRGVEVFILDFSFPKEVMQWMLERMVLFVWLDHHKTAFEMWCDEERQYCSHEDEYHAITLDNNKSGAYLSWEYFHPGTKVPMLIQHIDDYDRWQFKLDGTKEFNKALRSYAPWSFEQWRTLYWSLGCDENTRSRYPQFLAEGAAILRAHEQNVQAVVNGAVMTCNLYVNHGVIDVPGGETYDIEEFQGLAANCPPHLVSDVGHELANRSGTFGLLWSLDKDGRCNCSLRSNGNYDVSAIAKAFGGGGHKNAAGFEVPLSQLLTWLSLRGED